MPLWVEEVFDGVLPPPPPAATTPGTAGAAFRFCTGTADYYKFWPCRESVTLFGPAGNSLTLPWTAPTYNSWPVTDCKRRAPTTKELMGSAGGILATDLVWLLPDAVRPAAAVPKPGFYLRDADGDEWTVLEVMPRGRFGETWRLVTRNLAAFFSLTQLATVARPDAAVDAAGKRTPTYATVYANVRCRLQETAGTVESVHGGRTTPRQFDLVTTARIFLTAEDRVTVGGLSFSVTGWANPDRIAEPMVVRLERLP